MGGGTSYGLGLGAERYRSTPWPITAGKPTEPGIRSRPLLAVALTTNAIVPTDLVFAEKAKRARQMLEAAEADLTATLRKAPLRKLVNSLLSISPEAIGKGRWWI